MRVWVWILALVAGFTAIGQTGPGAGQAGGGVLQLLLNSEWANEIELTDDQKLKVASILRQNRQKMAELRRGASRSENDLELALSADQLDEKRVNDSIESLANNRAEMTRVVSQVTLQLRQALSGEQWRKLQMMQRRRGRLLNVP